MEIFQKRMKSENLVWIFVVHIAKKMKLSTRFSVCLFICFVVVGLFFFVSFDCYKIHVLTIRCELLDDRQILKLDFVPFRLYHVLYVLFSVLIRLCDLNHILWITTNVSKESKLKSWEKINKSCACSNIENFLVASRLVKLEFFCQGLITNYISISKFVTFPSSLSISYSLQSESKMILCYRNCEEWTESLEWIPNESAFQRVITWIQILVLKFISFLSISQKQIIFKSQMTIESVLTKNFLVH
jgi:hypothetical protein